MYHNNIYQEIEKASIEVKRLLAILIDPEKFSLQKIDLFLEKIPKNTSHLFVGGSTVPVGQTQLLVKQLKQHTKLPIVLFPGHISQITHEADALLFLSLLSGDNPEYLIDQQVKAVSILKNTSLEVIPTGYLLIEGGKPSAVAKITQTKPLPQLEIQKIVDTAKAGEYMGAKLIYLEAGSGAIIPVHPNIINAVKNQVNIPIIVGGGIKTPQQIENAYQAGATVVVMGTAFE